MQWGSSDVTFLAVCTATMIISAYCRNAVESSVSAKYHSMISVFDSVYVSINMEGLDQTLPVDSLAGPARARGGVPLRPNRLDILKTNPP